MPSTCVKIQCRSTNPRFPTLNLRPFFSWSADAEEGGGRDEENGYDDSDENMDGREYGFVMFDPVWGKPDYPPGHRTTACQVRHSCLCMMHACCTVRAQQAHSRSHLDPSLPLGEVVRDLCHYRSNPGNLSWIYVGYKAAPTW